MISGVASRAEAQVLDQRRRQREHGRRQPAEKRGTQPSRPPRARTHRCRPACRRLRSGRPAPWRRRTAVDRAPARAPQSPRQPRHWFEQRLRAWSRRGPSSNLLPVQYHRWSATWPLIITAERSLPETATLRLRRPLRLHQLAERRHAQMHAARLCSASEVVPGALSSSAQ